MDLRKAKESQSLFLGHKIKAGLVVLSPGEEVGEHITENREEFIFVIDGMAEICIQFSKGWEVIERRKAIGFSYVGKNRLHNVKNIGDGTLRYIYVVALH